LGWCSFAAVFKPRSWCFALSAPLTAVAATHVVSPADLQQELRSAAGRRQEQIAQIRGFLGTTEARRALATARRDPEKVSAAVALLNDQELARLSSQVRNAREFAAGSLSHFQITLIIIGAILVGVIIAVAAL
jgi:hypothetical protein